jgi:pimeloyl-ACP methyl ester carboxylesterase
MVRLRQVRATDGPQLDDGQWRHLSEHSITPDSQGGFRLHYDRQLTKAFKPPCDYGRKLWEAWESIQCPILVLRGAESDLLLPQTAAEMMARNPRAQVVEILGCGHAPPLMNDQQIRVVLDWLTRDEMSEEHCGEGWNEISCGGI